MRRKSSSSSRRKNEKREKKIIKLKRKSEQGQKDKRKDFLAVRLFTGREQCFSSVS